MSTLKVNTINAATANQGVAVDLQNPKSFRNLIINGAMQVAQRGTSSTTNGFGTVDRMRCTFRADADEACTQEQVDVASGTTPYTLGFRKAVKQTNGNQTSGAQANSYAQIIYAIEAQDVANSGWNYTSASSYITVSFWARASVAQTYTFHLETGDSTQQLYCHPYALSANTWTKVTKTIPGNSNITINNDNGAGLYFVQNQYLGTTYTTSGHTSNTWAAAGSFNDMAPDMTTTWWTTNDATFEMTGLQIEVGDVATDFEHRLYGDELARCQRYYYVHVSGANKPIGTGTMFNSAQVYVHIDFPQTMRTAPSLVQNTGTDYYEALCNGSNDTFNDFDAVWEAGLNNAIIVNYNDTSLTAGGSAMVKSDNASGKIAFNSEF